MIALRPPSYHTIEDPPPYPDDDLDDGPLTGVGDKRPPWLPEDSVTATSRAERLLATSGELLQLCDHEHADERLDHAVCQLHHSNGRRRRGKQLTSGRSMVSRSGQMNDPLAPWTNTRTCRLEGSDTSATSEQSWRYENYHEMTFDLPIAGGVRSPCSTGSPRPSDRSVGVPYSVTCPSRFDGFLLDAAGHAQPLDGQVPRPSVSGEPVMSAAFLPGRDVCRPESRQTSSVFEISSYIISNSTSNTLVQPNVAVEL